MDEITHIIRAIEQGDAKATEELLPLVYDELRKLAAHQLAGEHSPPTIQATELVDEAYLRLVGNPDQRWEGRRHFFGVAAEAMRRILIERARRQSRQKHGGGWQRVDWDKVELTAEMPSERLLALDEALGRLEEADATAAQLIKLRFSW